MREHRFSGQLLAPRGMSRRAMPQLALSNLKLWLRPGHLDSSTNWKDSMGYHTVTLNGSPALTRMQRSGAQGVTFDGVDDYATTSANFPLTGNPEFTVALWLMFRSSNARGLMGWGQTNIAGTIGCFGLWYGIRGSSLVSAEFSNTNTAYTSRVFSPLTPYFIAVTKTPGAINSTLNFYVDGAHVALGSASTNIPNIQAAPLCVGRWADYTAADSYNNCDVEQVMVYDRALGAGEVRHLHDWMR